MIAHQIHNLTISTLSPKTALIYPKLIAIIINPAYNRSHYNFRYEAGSFGTIGLPFHPTHPRNKQHPLRLPQRLYRHSPPSAHSAHHFPLRIAHLKQVQLT